MEGYTNLYKGHLMNNIIKHIVAVTGPKRSGKDTAASYLKSMFDYEPLAFAEPIKDILCVTLGISRETLDDFKNLTDSHKILGVESYGAFAEDEDDYVEFTTDMRQILQRFGTEAMKKHFGTDVWCKKLIQDALLWDLDNICVSDLRFIEEYEYLKEHCEKLTIIRLHKDGLEDDSHSSEQEYKQIPTDYDVSNNGTLQELYNKLNKIMTETTKDLE